MAATVTFIAVAVLLIAAIWHRRRSTTRDEVTVAIHLDQAAPGAHLIWDIANTGSSHRSLAKLVMHGRNGSALVLPFELPHRLAPQDHLVVPTDVDWALLGARAIAVVDADGHEFLVGHRQLASVQDQLREVFDRRGPTSSARDFLSGAADLAFGVVLLGLGFVMLMWVIATG